MKIVRYLSKKSSIPELGFLLNGKVLSFKTVSLEKKEKLNFTDITSYLQNLPESEKAAKALFEYAQTNFKDSNAQESQDLDKVTLLPPLIPPALFDFGVSPRHLKNSAQTLLRHEFSLPLRLLLGSFIKRKLDKNSKSEILPYYKGNHLEFIGTDDYVSWPQYTSYLDIEPELGIVVGTEAQPIAGYLVFNDTSARDIQFPEMIGTGPARCKDFSRSNGIGPYLVTIDEIPDPLQLKVDVKITDIQGVLRFHWEGSTSEYIRTPLEVVNYLNTIFTPVPGSLIGMGTIPDCTGLDNDLWLCPGDTAEITIDDLGTLIQKIPATVKTVESRWHRRTDF